MILHDKKNLSASYRKKKILEEKYWFKKLIWIELNTYWTFYIDYRWEQVKVKQNGRYMKREEKEENDD